MTQKEANAFSPLALAYIGDAIYELICREKMIERGNMPVNVLHKNTVSLVNASAQAKGLDFILEALSDEETAIYKRGRNAQSTVPKNGNSADYHKATGLEALFGYLYLCGRNERIRELHDKIFNLLWKGNDDG